MKPSKYSIFSLKLFGRFFEKHMSDQLEQKNLDLVKADIQMSYEEFFSMAVMNMILGYIITLIFTGIIHAIIPSAVTSGLLVLLPILVILCIGAVMLYYPTYRADVRGKDIDLFLPYAINFISSMAVAGISPAEIFETLSSVSVYGEVQKEAKKISKEIELMGADNIRALKHAIEITPSRKFKSFLQGIIGTIQSGSDLHGFLKNVSAKYMEEDLTDRKKDLDLLAVIAEILVLAVIAFPILLVIILTVFGFFGGSMEDSISLLLLFSFILLPSIYAMFYLLIRSTSIEKITKIQIKYTSIKTFFEDNKILLLILFVSSMSVLVFYIFLQVFATLGYFVFDQYVLWDFAFISFLMLIGPAGFYKYAELRTKKEMQTRLPDFLLEVSDSLATGMNIFDAVKTADKANYGKLSPEVTKMKNQLSWNVSIKNVLFDFANRMKTAIVERIIIVIDKAIYMGGNTSKIFKAGSNEVEQVNLVENQRKAIMSIYALVIIVCFGVFIAIMYILNTTIFTEFLNIQQKQATQASGLIAGVESSALIISKVDPALLKYTLYSFTFIESIGAGLLAGFMIDGKLASGVRYSIILGILTIIVFKTLF